MSTDRTADVGDRRPNIVLVHCHDLGRHLGCYGRSVETPHIDGLASDGVRFTNYFASAPQCSPSRGSIMTGRFPHQNGLMGLAHLGWELGEDETTLPSTLREAGYTTALFGVQHESATPEDLGYDHVDVEETAALDVADRFASSLQSLTDDDGPLFASLGFFEPHRTYRQPYIPDEAYDRYDPDSVDPLPYLPDEPGIREDLADMQSMLTATADPAVGRVREALTDAGVDDDTLLVFTTDHGIAFPRAKGTCYDPGLETALVVRYPGVTTPGTTVDALLSNVDLLPTLLDVAKVSHPPGVAGQSFRPLLTDDRADTHEGYSPRDHVYGELTWHDRYNPIRCLRTERYKYIRNFGDMMEVYLPSDVFGSKAGREVREEFYVGVRPEEELYDLEADPNEQENLASDRRFSDGVDEGSNPDPGHVETLESLRMQLHKWMRDTDDPLLDGPVAIRPHDRLDGYVR